MRYLIGNLNWMQNFKNGLCARGVTAEMDLTTHTIFQVTGRQPVTFRPLNAACPRTWCTKLDSARTLATILCSVDPLDGRHPGATVVTLCILSPPRLSGIILIHDINRGTYDAMSPTPDCLATRGLQFATVGQLRGWRHVAQTG